MNNVIEIAAKYIGMTEEKGNRFSDDSVLGKLIKAAGHKDGEAWCCYYAEGVYKEAYPHKVAELDRLFSANCVQTMKNFAAAGFDILPLPKVGTLAIFQRMKNGEPQTSGHCAIVADLRSTWEFAGIEGNSNDEGSREGYEVAYQPNRKVIKDVWNGLKIIGFIDIPNKYKI